MMINIHMLLNIIFKNENSHKQMTVAIIIVLLLNKFEDCIVTLQCNFLTKCYVK